MSDFYLSALIDFPDDVLFGLTKAENLVSLLKNLKECKVKRIFWYYYGEEDDSYFSNSNHPGKAYKRFEEMLLNIHDFNKFLVDTAHSLDMKVVGVMRCAESGNAGLFSEFYPEIKEASKIHKVKSIGGYVPGPNKYLKAHPDARIKRRTFDIDTDAENLNVCKIELRKQNDLPTRIKKEDLKIYVSDNNYDYQEYKGDFDFEISYAICDEDVKVVDKTKKPYYDKIITHKGDRVTTIVLSGFDISENFVAVTCKGDFFDSSDNLFKNTLSKSIYCYGKNNRQIPISVGNDFKIWKDPENRSWKECGLSIDNGFGDNYEYVFDIPEKESVIGFGKGKNRYIHSHLCECDKGVQEYWFKSLEKCLNNGFDLISSREENHSIMINDAFSFGYNDSIKEKYFSRYGKCEEKDMDIEKIAKIRGDVYSELFKKGAEYVRKKGKKVALMLNLEMLHNPIPTDRIFAYPMNVEWQWEKWLEEIKADEIIIRTYRYTPEFVLKDEQCLEIINKAYKTGVPLTYERYTDDGTFIEDYKTIKETGLFESITLYETFSEFRFDENGQIYAKNPDFIKALKEL